MEYIGPFQRFQVKNYQIIVNSLPKFRDGSIEKFDANSVDDCLIRYIGTLEDLINRVAGKIRNPIIWFKEGFLELISLPLYLFNWFGILSNNAILKVKSSLIYKIIVGIGSLITFLSGVVTIILGKEETIKFINNLFK